LAQVCAVCGYRQNRDTATFCSSCGGALPGLGTGKLPPRTTLHGRYVIVKQMGQGGMGAVYQVTDLRLPGKVWALKEMSAAALTSAAERALAVDAFQQEARLLATLDHPNLPQVVDYFEEGGKHYLVMDFVEGELLEEIVARSGPLPEATVVGLAAQLCDVLEYLHSQSPPVIFRDLKPGNVMVTPEGVVKLIDFGIARFFKTGQASDTQAIGTPGFSPPEQHGRSQTDARSDVYSLGVTLHQLLTGYDPGQSPFQLPRVRTLNPAVSVRMEEVITQATEIEPARRFRSAREMKQALQTQAAPPGAATVSPPRTAAQAPARRWPAGAAIAVLLLGCLTCGVGAWALFNGETPPAGRTNTATAPVIGSPAATLPALPTPGAADTATPASVPEATAIAPSPSMPAPSSTPTPTTRPTEPAPPMPSPIPPAAEVEAAIEDLILRYVEVKQQAVGRWETRELDTVLREDALRTQLGSVNWLRENNAHWELELHALTFDRFEHQGPEQVRVMVTKVETGRYYHQGSTTPSTKQSYYNTRYQVWYDVKMIDGGWYITNIDL
jgi:serine/threonine-protein kinase